MSDRDLKAREVVSVDPRGKTTQKQSRENRRVQETTDIATERKQKSRDK